MRRGGRQSKAFVAIGATGRAVGRQPSRPVRDFVLAFCFGAGFRVVWDLSTATRLTDHASKTPDRNL